MAEPVILQGVFDRTAGLLAGIGREQWELPTPCPDFDVRALADHLVGFLQTFAAAVSGEPAPVSGGAQAQLTDDRHDQSQPRSAGEFRASADLAVRAWREGAAERLVTVGPDEVPGALAFDLMLVECLAHGWELAVATGQPASYSDVEALAALTAVTPMLTDDRRGPGRQFGAAVPVPDDAAPLARLMASSARSEHDLVAMIDRQFTGEHSRAAVTCRSRAGLGPVSTPPKVAGWPHFSSALRQ